MRLHRHSRRSDSQALHCSRTPASRPLRHRLFLQILRTREARGISFRTASRIPGLCSGMSHWNALPASMRPWFSRMWAHPDMTCFCRSGDESRVPQCLFRKWSLSRRLHIAVRFLSSGLSGSIPCALCVDDIVRMGARAGFRQPQSMGRAPREATRITMFATISRPRSSGLCRARAPVVLSHDALSGWGVDGRFFLRSSYPVTVLGNLFNDPVTGERFHTGADLIPDKPLYLPNRSLPGGRVLNGGPDVADGAFQYPAAGSQGNAPRNMARGFGAQQLSLSLRRDIHLHDRLGLQLRGDVFNVSNSPRLWLYRSKSDRPTLWTAHSLPEPRATVKAGRSTNRAARARCNGCSASAGECVRRKVPSAAGVKPTCQGSSGRIGSSE